MPFIDSPTEWTTAVTDLILTAETIFAIFYLTRFRPIDRWKASIWMWLFGAIGLATFFGAIYHGLVLNETALTIIWQFVSFFVALSVVFFVVATVRDTWSERVARRVLPQMLVVSLIFLGLNLLWLGNQFIFLGYQAIAMLFALSGYIWRASGKKLKGSWFIASATFLAIVAAVIQATDAVSIEFIWQFDENGVSHLLQMIAVPLFLIGLQQGLGKLK